jgi:RNA polymerase sigma-70 factor (ECF subfamily)
MQEDHQPLKGIEQLIEGCRKGDQQSQSRLYYLFNQKMFVVCLRYSKNREEAEEILQEGFMRVFECIHQYKHAGPLEGWIRKIMVNCALQKYRSSRHLQPVVNVDVIELPHMDSDDIIAKIGTKELLNMVQKLPSSYRIIFNLYVFEGMKHREIAELLGIAEGTSKSNLSNARALLQKAINNSLQFSKINFV